MNTDIGPARWFAKKAARLAVAATSLARPRARDGRTRIRVLTYHRFGSAHRDPFCVTAAGFERQMRHLAERKLAVSQAEVMAFLEGRAGLADGAVLVTMDDGDPSVARIAAPILAHHRIPAVAFVVSAGIGRPGHMDEAELRALPQAGIEVGSHSATHRSMARIPPIEAMQELTSSRHRIEDVMGRPVTSFAYPFGTLADFNEIVAGMLVESGYRLAFTSQHGPLVPGLAPMTLPRIKVEGGDPYWMFPALCAGAMDDWRLVDRTLFRLQRPATAGSTSRAPMAENRRR